MDICWDCVKGRHTMCEGGPCECPVPLTECSRQPEYDNATDTYLDPGEQACADGEARTNNGCGMHDPA